MQHHHPQFDGPSEYDMHMDQHLLYPSSASSSFPPFTPLDSGYSNSTQMDLRNLLLNPRNLLPSPKGYMSHPQESPASFPLPSYSLNSSTSSLLRDKLEPTLALPPPPIPPPYQFDEPYSYGTQVFDSMYATAPSRISPVAPEFDVSQFPSPQPPSSTQFSSYYSFSPCPSPQATMVPSPALTSDLLSSRPPPPAPSSYLPYPLYSYEPLMELPTYLEDPVPDPPPKPDPPFPLPWIEPKPKKNNVGPKPFVCRFPPCTASFNRNHDLKRHERIHTGEKRWECDVCGRAFGRRDALSRHTSAPGGRCKAVFGKRVRKAGLKMEFLLNKAANELREMQQQ